MPVRDADRTAAPDENGVKKNGAGRRLWILLVFALLAAAILLTGWIYYRNYEKQFRAGLEQELQAIADLKVADLAQYRKGWMKDGSIFFHNAPFAALVRRFLENPDDTDARRQLEIWLGRYQPYYDRIVLLDAQGAPRLSVPAGPLAAPPLMPAEFPDVLSSGREMIQDFYVSAQDHRVHLGVWTPIFDDRDPSRPLAVFLLRVDPETWLYPRIQRWPGISQTAEMLLVRRAGNEVVYLNNLRFRTNSALNLRLPLDRATLPAAQAALGREGFMEGIDYRGVRVVAETRKIPDSPWALVARMDAAEAYAPMKEQLRQVICITVALLSSAVAWAGLVWRRQRLIFFREKARTTEALRASEFRYRRLFEAARDGVLILDSGTGMVVDVNPFLIELLGYPREALLGKKVWELGIFKDIIANQAHFAELQQKEYIRYDDKPLETSDGRQIQVEFVSNVYQCGGEKVIQCNIRDITERKRAEEAVAKAQAMQRAVLDGTDDFIFSVESKDFRLLTFNRAFGDYALRHRGKRLEVGQRTEDLLPNPDFVQLWYSYFRQVLASGPFTTEHVLDSGEATHLLTMNPLLHGKDIFGISVFLKDISERKRAEAALQESQALYQSLVEQAPVGVLRKDTAGRYVFVNAWFCRLAGAKPEHFLGKTPAETVRALANHASTGLEVEHLSRLASDTDEHHAAILRTGAQIKLEEERVSADGQRQYFHVVKGPVLAADGKITGTQTIVIDVTDRKQAEAALRESQALYQSLVEQAPVGVFRKDAAGRYVFVNAWFCQFTGGKSEYYLGKTAAESTRELMEHCSPTLDAGQLARLAASADEHHAAIMRTGALIELEEERVWADGRRQYLHVVKGPVLGADGKIAGTQGIQIDITARKQAEVELQRTNRALQLMSLFNQELVRVTDEKELMQIACDLAVQIGGYRLAWIGFAEQDEAKSVRPAARSGLDDGYLDTARITWAETERGNGPVGSAIRSGQPVIIRDTPADRAFEPWREAAMKRGFASCIALPLQVQNRCLGALNLYAAQPDAFNPNEVELLGELASDLAYGIGALRHRAEREKAEAEANRAAREWQTTFDATNDAIWILDKDQRVLRSNKTAERYFQRPCAEILGRNCWPIVHGTPEPVPGCPFIRAMKSGHRERMELRKGNQWLEEIVDPILDAAGQPVGAVHIVSDVTESRRLAEELIEAQKMNVIGHLAGGVAHDFNNIISIIMSYNDMIKESLDRESPLQAYSEEVRQAAERAAGLTRQLLIFSRKQAVQPVVLDLNDVLRDLDKMLRRLIHENIEMTVVPGEEIGRVMADSGYMGQVLMNLVVNARDAMPNGGKLTIATHNVTLQDPPADSPGGARPGRFVMLSVSDTGTGMTDEVKARLFEAFFTTKPKGKGTGLGLATCQTIVQQSGGHITVDTAPGHGTTFKVCFPQVEQPLGVGSRAMPSGPLPRGTETLLVVEDDPSVRHLAQRVLETQGYEVLRASNGQDALHVARDHKGAPIRLVITDVIMPRMGGRVMAEWLKASMPDLKILFTSGYTEDVIAQHGVLEPGTDFLPKPYTPAALAHKVRAMLDAG